MSGRYQATSRPSLRTFELSQPRTRLPISPPETERNAPAHSIAVEPKIPVVATPEGESQREESPFRHLRRAPSVHYNNQSAAFARTPQTRSPRWLLVVLPPASCVEGESALGHTLATGAPGRLQSGVLVPLFPTMYGQLAAIAKEFNFPSTAGVCLYLHVSEPGVNIAPRISDDAWQLLWNSYFNPDDSNSPTTPSGLPICGQIEFDVDVRKARWYESWLTGQEIRISLDESIPPSVAQTMSRWYQEHREVVHDTSDSLLNDNAATTFTAPVRSKPIPRPLTLSTRSDGLKSLAKYKVVGNSRETDAIEPVAAKRAPSRLSPVVQVDEPASNQKDIDALVRNWRATTPMAPVIPRTGPAGESIPDTYDLPFSDIDMDDFQFSVSSAGPPSRWLASVELDDPLHSVGLDRRMLGSVVLTPSVATSFGPDDSFPTPTFSNASRFPSPDLAARMIEDSPATPTTATSWGAPLSWPATPASADRLASPDMAARAFISVPNTPTTATSWGAPSVWPETPASVYYPVTPDLGRRAFGSTPPTPTTATSWGAPEFWPPSPIEDIRPSTPDIAARAHDEEIEDLGAYRFVWPFFDGDEAQPYKFVWPFLEGDETQPYNLVWPFFEGDETQPYNFVWPFLNHEVNTISENGAVPSSSSLSEISPFSLVWPYFAAPSTAKDLHLSALYPSISANGAVYPNLVIYPSYGTDSAEHGRIQKVLEEKICPSYDCELALFPSLKMLSSVQTIESKADFIYLRPDPNLVIYAEIMKKENQVSSERKTNYGYFDLYPAVYPSVVPYPARYECSTTVLKGQAPTSNQPLEQTTALSPLYPFFDLYPASYPSLVIYPLAKLASRTQPKASIAESSVQSTSNYPYLVLYTPVYPHLEIYPAVAASLQEKKAPVTKEFISAEKENPCSTVLKASYPFFNLYPALYPALEIYPVCYQAPSRQRSTSPVRLADLKLQSHYPRLDIYPAVYPHMEIYPSSSPSRRQQLQISVLEPTKEVEKCRTALPFYYPYIAIYPSAYPFLEIYPPTPLTALERPITPSYLYPNLVIYESVRGGRTDTLERSREWPLSVRLEPAYPNFNLYPAGYPHLEIYPCTSSRVTELEPVLLPGAMCNYPTLCIYPAVQQVSRHRKVPSISISIRMPESTMRSLGSPRQRTRRGSNQWALTSVSSPAAPRLRRGSVNASDSCDVRAPAVTSNRKPVARPRIKPRKSHADLVKEVFAKMSITERVTSEDNKVLAPSGASGLRRVASARVDEVPRSALNRSRTIPTPMPPVPRKKRTLPPSNQEDSFSVGTSVDAIVAAMNALDGPPAGSNAEGFSPLGRRVSKLDRNRYPSRI